MSESAAQPTPFLEAPRYCRGCGYDLRALTAPRCPECGRAFDPADPRSTLRRPRRRWMRWARRAGYGLLALMLLLAAVWGWFYWGWYEEQQALLRLQAREHAARPLAPWLRQRLGSPGFVLDRVWRVRLGARTDPREFGVVARLTQMESLELWGTPVRDLRPLTELPKLRDLGLYGVRMIDPRPLAEGPKVEDLSINRPGRLDLTSLARCQSLRQLKLFEVDMTVREGEALQRALPDCKISWY